MEQERTVGTIILETNNQEQEVETMENGTLTMRTEDGSTQTIALNNEGVVDYKKQKLENELTEIAKRLVDVGVTYIDTKNTADYTHMSFIADNAVYQVRVKNDTILKDEVDALYAMALEDRLNSGTAYSLVSSIRKRVFSRDWK